MNLLSRRYLLSVAFALATTGMLTVSAVPEPASFAVLFGLAALGFTATRRRRRLAPL